MLANLTQNKSLMKGLTLVLVVVSAVLAFFDIEAILNMLMLGSSMLLRDGKTAMALVTPMMLVLGIGALAFIIVTFEYHLKHAGEKSSQKLLVISLAAQTAIFAIGYVALGPLVH
jgi:ATP/ADP translocase